MHDSRTPPFLPFAIGLAILAVSTASILIRLAQQDAPSITIAALRLAFATAVLAPIALIKHRTELSRLGSGQLLLALASGIFLAIHFATWITSLQYTTVASSVVFVSTGPLWVALLSPIFLRERVGSAAMIGLGLAVLGGIVIAIGDSCTWHGALQCAGLGTARQSSGMWGNLLALFGAWAVTGYLIIGRRLRSALSLIPYVFLVYGSAAVILLGSAAATGNLMLALPGKTYLWIVLLALVPQLIGHSTYNWALKFLPAAAVAVTTLGEPIGSAVLAYIVLREQPGAWVLIGAVLILTGIYLAARGAARLGQANKAA
jgi:drug/metabolite transporter (DMT)-like permease